MRAGRICRRRATAGTLSAALLREVFGVLTNVVTDPAPGAPVCIPYAAADTDDLLPVSAGD